MTEIITLASSETNTARSRRYPVLEAGNMSFPDGRYAVDFKPQKKRSSFLVRHDVQNAALIRRLVENGTAKYCCTVSSPVSSYRRMHLSHDAAQEIEWNTDNMGEPPLFTPMVIAVEARTLELCAERDNVHPMWAGQRVAIDKGARVAIGPVVRLKPTLVHLLRFTRDTTRENGTFRVDAESQPFQFVVALSIDMHQFLQYGKRDSVRGHIMTHIVTACLALLQRDFSVDHDQEENGLHSDRNLDALADYLEQKGLPHWTDTENFRPEEVATALYPHLLDDNRAG